MPSAQLSQLLDEASVKIEDKIMQYGGEHPLLGDYVDFFGDLLIEAWQYRSVTGQRVTYNTIFDMIVGLKESLGRLDDVESNVYLFRMIEGRPRRAGAGLIRFVDSRAEFGSNRTTSSSSNARNATIASPIVSNRNWFDL